MDSQANNQNQCCIIRILQFVVKLATALCIIVKDIVAFIEIIRYIYGEIRRLMG